MKVCLSTVGTDYINQAHEHGGGNKDTCGEGLITNNNRATQEKTKQVATFEGKSPKEHKNEKTDDVNSDNGKGERDTTNIKMRTNSKKKKKVKTKKITKKKSKVTFKPQKMR